MGSETRGSIWRKWDLHIHTPDSFHHNYGGATEEAWDNFLADLERLPREFKAIGINDYFFIDGYCRVIEAKNSGRLSNIDLILPVIELRLDKFGGTESALSRVNLHVIFSNELEPDTIRSQFILGLTRKFTLSPSPSGKQITWKGLVTKESITDLGQKIIDSVPENHRSRYGSPIKEGYGNLSFSYENIRDLLSNPDFANKYLIAVGKTEWENIKWNDQSIADKKDIINGAHFVFTAAPSFEDFHRSKKRLIESGVNSRLLDCSDAHTFSSSTDKDRIGNCFTWIKADTTFEGLLHSHKNYDERIFVGSLPDKLQSAKERPNKYIRSLRFSKILDLKADEYWFESVGEIQFNHGLVAIIGNKGNAKSALTDILGLLGNTANHNYFSFLTTSKFKQQKGMKAKCFQATLTLENGQSFTKTLDSEVNPDDPQVLKYIPQNFFENVCNEIGVTEGNFAKELEQVIFSHVSVDDRLEKTSLKELISHKTSEITDAITQLRVQLESVNRDIATRDAELTLEHRNDILAKLESVQQELASHRQQKPTPVALPQDDKADASKNPSKLKIEENNNKIKLLDEEIAEATKALSSLKKLETNLNKAQNHISNFVNYYERTKNEFEKFEIVDVNFDQIFKITVNTEVIKSKIHATSQSIQTFQSILNPDDPNSLPNKKQALLTEITTLQEKLAQPEKEYHSYLATLKKWEKKEKLLLTGQNNSIQYYENIIRKLDALPEQISKLKKERLALCLKIFREIQRITLTYKELYKPVQVFIQNHSLANKFVLNFDVSIEEKGFKEKFFDWISQGVVGSFCGKENGKQTLEELLNQHDFNTEEGITQFLENLDFYLTHDVRQNPPTELSILSQLKKERHADDLYNYIFSLEYLSPLYVLKMGEKELHQLSPGEKGALLLVFYLLIDFDDMPLIIDQPEENLDNQTVYDLLVPSIGEARKRRQIIIVTHNPNIAVVCDAEQIIYASIDKLNGNKVEYLSGSTENYVINKKLLDVLEGTSPAFVKRHAKYIPEHLISW